MHYKFYPKVDLLYKWSHWITPAFEKYRYDTNFYISVLTSIPAATIDNTEVIHMNWLTPHQALTIFSSGKIMLPPPTWITLNQLIPATTLDKLKHLCENRAPPIPWLPILESELQKTQHTQKIEELVLVLPGDERYPNEASKKGTIHCMIIGPENTYTYINGSISQHSKL